MRFLIIIPILFLTGCALLFEDTKISVVPDSQIDLPLVCNNDKNQKAFYINFENDKVLVNLRQENYQEWFGPVILPLIPHFGKKIWVMISSNKTQADASTFGNWRLISNQKIFSPTQVLQQKETQFEFKTLTTLIFEDREIYKAENLELHVPQNNNSNLKLVSNKKWFYMPFFGAMGAKPSTGRCGDKKL